MCASQNDRIAHWATHADPLARCARSGKCSGLAGINLDQAACRRTCRRERWGQNHCSRRCPDNISEIQIIRLGNREAFEDRHSDVDRALALCMGRSAESKNGADCHQCKRANAHGIVVNSQRRFLLVHGGPYRVNRVNASAPGMVNVAVTNWAICA